MWEADVGELRTEANPGKKHVTLSEKHWKQKMDGVWLVWPSNCLANARP
jgi:hypothetical protein